MFSAIIIWTLLRNKGVLNLDLVSIISGSNINKKYYKMRKRISMKSTYILKLDSKNELFAKIESALAGIWTRVGRATAAYTRPDYTTRAT